MKHICAIALCCLLTGCINLIERWPTTSSKVAETYQATLLSTGMLGYAVNDEAYIDKVDHVVACVCFVPLLAINTALEAVCDTVLYPADLLWTWDTSSSNENK